MAGRLNLVTGAMGFTGSYVVRELLRDGQRVVGTDLPGAVAGPEFHTVARNIGLDTAHPDLELIPADLLDRGSLDSLFRRPITHVFHPASLYDYSASLERLRRINVTGTRNLIEAATGANLERFVHWSTCGVFGKPYTAADGQRVNVPFSEESSSPKTEPPGATGPRGTHLVNAYSQSKWEQEQLVWAAHRAGDLPVTVLRPAPIYGPGSDYGHGGIILAIAQGFLPAIPADAKNYITTSVHVEDTARLALLLADRDDTLGDDYDAVDSSIISYHEFLHYIALLTGRRLRDVPLLSLSALKQGMMRGAAAWTWLERRFKVPRVRVFEVQSTPYMTSSYWLDNSKSRSTGFQYNYPDVREGLKETVAWFREQGWLTDRSRSFYVGQEGSKDTPPAH